MRKWYFPKAEKIGINGLNNIASSFLDTPLKTLAKEICQNSLDTKMSKYYKEEWSKKIKIEFNEFWVNASELDGYEELLNVIKAEYEFAKSYYVNDKSVINFYQNALNCLQQDKIRCLRISDYNTPGLTGSNLKNHSAWADLVKISEFQINQKALRGVKDKESLQHLHVQVYIQYFIILSQSMVLEQLKV